MRQWLSFMFCILFVSLWSFSYSQNWLWAKSSNGSIGQSANEGYSVSADASGNLFATGFFASPTITFGFSTLVNTDPSGNTSDIFIVKYDANGNVLWGKSTGGAQQDVGYSLSTDASGNVFLIGFFSSSSITFGSTTLTNNSTSGGADLFIAKYDPNGNVLWAKNVGGSGDDEGYSISADAAGNVSVTGFFQSPTITFGTTVLTNTGVANMFIAKYDAFGNALWAKSIGGTYRDEGYSVKIDAGGNTYVTGWYSTSIIFGSTTLVNAGGTDLFIAKYDPNGIVLWAKSAGGAGDDEGYSVGVDLGGNVFVTGYFQSPSITFGAATLTNSGSRNVFIAKYDASGNVLWAKSAVGTGSAEGYSVGVDASGNVFVTGGFYSPTIAFGSIILSLPTGSVDPMFIVKYDTNGNALCGSALSSGGDDQNGVSVDPLGNAYIGSDFGANPFIIGSDTLVLTGGENVFVAKWSCGCSLSAASINGNTSICMGQVITINANPIGGAYSWSNGSNVNTISVSPTTTSTYSVIVSYGNCADTAIVTVLVNPLPSPSIIGNTTICLGQNVVLNAAGGTNYLWSTGASTQTISVSPTSTSTYTVVVKDNNGCSADTTISIIVNPNSIATTSGSVTIFPSQITTLTASGGVNYLWNTAETTTTISVSPTITTLYCVTVTDTSNCKDSICATVFIESPCDTAGAFFFPNAFSPNNDGDNDYLKAYYKEMNCIATLHLIIYDRWGEMVYETLDKNFSWDGTYPNKPLNTQVLAYQLIVGFTDGKAINRKGNISLVR